MQLGTQKYTKIDYETTKNELKKGGDSHIRNYSGERCLIIQPGAKNVHQI